MLEQQAQSAAYVQYRSVELPPFSVPIRSRIGFKVDPRSGHAILYIQKGCRYYGTNTSIRRWFEEGQVTFPTFSALREWIGSELRNEFLKGSDLCPLGEPALPVETPNNRLVAGESEPVPEPKSGSAEVDPLIADLIVGQIKQIGRKHGLEIQRVDSALISLLADKLRREHSRSPQDIIEQDLAEPFARAALLTQACGSDAVVLHAGPPITCEPIERPPNRRYAT